MYGSIPGSGGFFFTRGVSKNFSMRFKPLIERGFQGLKECSITGGRSGSDEKQLGRIIRRFLGVDTTIGYGSGVFAQEGYEGKTRPQVDLIHIVKDTRQFHSLNLARHAHHYSGLKYGGVGLIEMVQKLGVGLYYNPFVNIDGTMVKYGIMARDTALKDIIEWNNLYLAGRLQKPVKFIGDSLISQVNQFNLRNAMIISILMRDTQIVTKEELYETITSLSYLGDFRMVIGGENPHKIRNIVSKQMELFNRLYEPILDQLERENILEIRTENIHVKLNKDFKYQLVNQLPINFRNKLFETYTNSKDTLIDRQFPKKLTQTIQKIVLGPSIVQSFKGIFTAGVYKSLTYIIEKRMKYLSSRGTAE